MSRRVLKASAWFLGTAVGLAVGTWFIFFRSVHVKGERPLRGELVVEVFGTGTLESKIVVGVSAKIVGKVVDVQVDQGDTVTAGHVLAQLENKDFEDAARVAMTQCDQARAELAKAKAEVERRRSLVKGKIISREELDVYETSERVAQAKMRNAEAACGVAQAKLEDTRIVSPASGLVITRNLEVGATVVPGAPIFRIAVSAPWVVAQVDEHATGTLNLGQPARVMFQTDPTLPQPGHVARLGEEADRVTEEREVDVTLDHLPANHFLGQRADVYVETSRKQDALQVPRDALVERGGKPGVFVVDAGRARWRQVQFGLKGRNAVEVIGGVTEQDVVIRAPLGDEAPITEGARVIAAPEGKEL